MRKFNTAGPSVPGDHYMSDPLARIDVTEVVALIGKGTALLALMHSSTLHK
jgi:hypothetical protein